MSTVSLSGNDIVKINERILADFASDDIATLTFPNDLAALKTGKNGNTIYASNETGKQAELVLKVIRGSSDDKYLSNLLNSQKLNFANFILMTGEMIKRIGDGTGKIISDTYILSGGIFKKEIEAKSNVSGDVEQSISTYNMIFSIAPRALE